MPAPRKRVDPDTAVTYARVSTEEQASSGLGLGAQTTKVTSEVEHRGWRHVRHYADEGLSAKTIEGRPQLVACLAALDAGEAANLVVAKLDRLSRSVHDFTGLMLDSQKRGWNLVVLDLGLDTSTPNGKFMAHVLAAVAELERELIGQRTSAALQQLRRQGVVLGRPDRAGEEIVESISVLRDCGMSLADIAESLTDRQVPTSQGGARWYPSSVAAVLRRRTARV